MYTDVALGLENGYEIIDQSAETLKWDVRGPTDFMSANYNTSTDEWTAPSNSIINIKSTVMFEFNGTQYRTQDIQLRLLRNGSSVSAGTVGAYVATGNNDPTSMSIDWTGKVNAGDKFKLVFYSNPQGNGSTSLINGYGSNFVVVVE